MVVWVLNGKEQCSLLLEVILLDACAVFQVKEGILELSHKSLCPTSVLSGELECIDLRVTFLGDNHEVAGRLRMIHEALKDSPSILGVFIVAQCQYSRSSRKLLSEDTVQKMVLFFIQALILCPPDDGG